MLSYVLKRRPELAGVVATTAGLRSPVLEQKLKMTLARVLRLGRPDRGDAKRVGRQHDLAGPQGRRGLPRRPARPRKASLALGKHASIYAQWTMDHAGKFPLPLLLLG